MTEYQNFDEWLRAADVILRERWPDYPFRDAAGQLYAEAWKEVFYDEGMTPEDAVAEEIASVD